MGLTILHAADWLLWILMAASTLYALFYAFASLLPKGADTMAQPSDALPQPSFLVLFPAYREDAVILHSVESFLCQDYPTERFHVAVISDHMQPSTNEQLAALPITLLTPSFTKSSKAKALQYAVKTMDSQGTRFDYVVILDADNVTHPDYLNKLSTLCQQGHKAIQCHRTAKNSDNDIAALDGLSEEVNNSIFRRGHNRIGLSSALIGSGMCFDYSWFRDNVGQLDSAVEDRELEALLMRQGVYIHYAEDILVMDEKVSNSDNFQRQRQRWMTGQVQTLLLMLPYLPKAILTGNINYIDKTIQQALIPRSLLLLFTLLFAAMLTLCLFATASVLPSVVRWWLLFAAQCLTLFIATPSRLRLKALRSVLLAPRLAGRMASNLLHVRLSDREFRHTTHGT